MAEGAAARTGAALEWQGTLNVLCCGMGVASGRNAAAPVIILGVQLIGFALLLAFPVRFLTVQLDTPAIAVVAVVLCVSTVSFFLTTALSDPGFLPRCPRKETPGPPMLQNSRPPRKQNFVAHGRVVTKQYCDTCNLFQPPLTVHCSVCKNCVRRFDHHCPWVGNCIGERNYRYFFMFLMTSTLLLVFSIAVSVVEVVMRADAGHSFEGAVGSIALVVLCVLLLLFVLALVAFHVQLLCNNQTTFEQLTNLNELLKPVGSGMRAILQLLFGPVEISYAHRWLAQAKSGADSDRDLAEKVYALGNRGTAREVPLKAFSLESYLVLPRAPRGSSASGTRDAFVSISSHARDEDDIRAAANQDDVDSVNSFDTAPGPAQAAAAGSSKSANEPCK